MHGWLSSGELGECVPGSWRQLATQCQQRVLDALGGRRSGRTYPKGSGNSLDHTRCCMHACTAGVVQQGSTHQAIKLGDLAGAGGGAQILTLSGCRTGTAATRHRRGTQGTQSQRSGHPGGKEASVVECGSRAGGERRRLAAARAGVAGGCSSNSVQRVPRSFHAANARWQADAGVPGPELGVRGKNPSSMTARGPERPPVHPRSPAQFATHRLRR